MVVGFRVLRFKFGTSGFCVHVTVKSSFVFAYGTCSVLMAGRVVGISQNALQKTTQACILFANVH